MVQTSQEQDHAKGRPELPEPSPDAGTTGSLANGEEKRIAATGLQEDGSPPHG